MLTDKELQEIKDRLAKATPGPRWAMHIRHVDYGPGDDAVNGLGWDWGEDGPPQPQLRGVLARWADATFIEHAHSDIAALIAEVERLRAIVSDMETAKIHIDATSEGKGKISFPRKGYDLAGPEHHHPLCPERTT